MSEEPLFDVLTVREVAQAGGVSERRVRQLCQSGQLACVKVTGAWFVSQASAWRWVRRERKPGRPRKGTKLEQGVLELEAED